MLGRTPFRGPRNIQAWLHRGPRFLSRCLDQCPSGLLYVPPATVNNLLGTSHTAAFLRRDFSRPRAFFSAASVSFFYYPRPESSQDSPVSTQSPCKLHHWESQHIIMLLSLRAYLSFLGRNCVSMQQICCFVSRKY